MAEGRSDNQIIDLFFARSQEAIPALDEKYGAACRRLARNLLPSPDAEEAVNDGYLGVWDAIPPARPDPLPAFVLKVMRNQALKRRRQDRALKRNSSYDVSLQELEGVLPAASGTEELLNARELTRLLDRFLSGLGRTARIAFVRRYYFGDPTEEIARLLHMRAHAVTVKLARLRGKLKQFLAEEGYDHEP